MSKKKAKAKKAPPKKATAAKKSAKVVKMQPKAAKRRTASPRSQVLPGMEQVRNRALDRICENISDVRADLNRARAEDKDLQGQAVRVMSSASPAITAYRFAGVELVLVPGDAHLRVRTLKVQANTDGPAEETGPATDAGITEDEIDGLDDSGADQDEAAEA